MLIKNIWRAVILAPLLYSCQSEDVQPDTPVYKPITVKATLPSDDIQSRAQITYGNPNEDYEIFMWDTKDWFTLFNMTRLSDCPFGVALEEVGIYNDGKTADFESFSSVDSTFVIKKGDVLLAVYGEINRVRKKDENGELYYDDRNIITMVLGAEANKPQVIAFPPTNADLSYMKDNLKMYDIVVAEDDAVVPHLNFRHLSSIMRVTVRNQSGEDVYPTKLEFDYPGCEAFYNATLYFSVDTTSADYGLIAYTTEDLYGKNPKPYTSKFGTTVNQKEDTSDAGESIPNGESYELYLSVVPRLNNDSKGNGLTISLIENHVTENPFKLSIDGFDAIIKPGLRYWFDVTLLPDKKMVLTRSLQEESNE